jgi:hypothetical protein
VDIITYGCQTIEKLKLKKIKINPLILGFQGLMEDDAIVDWIRVPIFRKAKI